MIDDQPTSPLGTIRLFLTKHATPLLSMGAPMCVVMPPQMVQNAVACLVFSQPKWGRFTPLLIELHWLPVAVSKFKSPVLAHRVLLGSAPLH